MEGEEKVVDVMDMYGFWVKCWVAGQLGKETTPSRKVNESETHRACPHRQDITNLSTLSTFYYKLTKYVF